MRTYHLRLLFLEFGLPALQLFPRLSLTSNRYYYDLDSYQDYQLRFLPRLSTSTLTKTTPLNSRGLPAFPISSDTI